MRLTDFSRAALCVVGGMVVGMMTTWWFGAVGWGCVVLGLVVLTLASEWAEGRGRNERAAME